MPNSSAARARHKNRHSAISGTKIIFNFFLQKLRKKIHKKVEDKTNTKKLRDKKLQKIMIIRKQLRFWISLQLLFYFFVIIFGFLCDCYQDIGLLVYYIDAEEEW